MTAAEMLPLLQQWKAQSDQLTAAYEPLRRALRLDPENAIHEAMWTLFDVYTETLSKMMGDEGEFLAWFAGDNDMGAAGYRACPGNGYERRAVHTLKDLAQLIVESRNV